MMSNKKPTIVWFQGITCNGNTHSLLSANSNRLELFLKSFNLLYHPSLTVGITLDDILNLEEKIDFLLVEGSISDNSHYFKISNDNTYNHLQRLIKKTNYLICVGSCSSYGGIHAQFKQHNSVKSVRNYFSEVKLKHEIINLSGCPVHPEWILQTIFALNSYGKIALDEEYRPKELYSNLVHHGCTRNEYFEWKVEGNYGTKEGCLFYEQGCKGPMTQGSCNKILWNEVSSKTRAGMPCIGCTEASFPRDDMFETKKNIGIPQEVPKGISKRAYLSITGIAKTFKIDRLHKKLMD